MISVGRKNENYRKGFNARRKKQLRHIPNKKKKEIQRVDKILAQIARQQPEPERLIQPQQHF